MLSKWQEMVLMLRGDISVPSSQAGKLRLQEDAQMNGGAGSARASPMHTHATAR